MKLNFQKTADVQIGCMRVPREIHEKIKAIADLHKVSRQEVIRAILIKVIDDIESPKNM